MSQNTCSLPSAEATMRDGCLQTAAYTTDSFLDLVGCDWSVSLLFQCWHLMLDQINWAQAACRRLLRPVIRLALTMGMKHLQLEALLRELLLEEAHRLWASKGTETPNISQLAVTTGLSRKDITARVRVEIARDPSSDMSPATKVFTLWRQIADDDATQGQLPIRASEHTTSFESLAKQATKGNVHHRSVLDDLIRLGMVTERGDHVELTAEGFVPAGDLKAMMDFIASNVGDHLDAAVSNTIEDKPRMLERAVYADGLSEAECAHIHQLARQRWNTLHHDLVQEMNAAVDRSGAVGTQRIKVGVYVFTADDKAPENPVEKKPKRSLKKADQP